MNWQEMCKIEPRLKALQEKADNALFDDPSNVNFWRNYEGIKSALRMLVGIYAEKKELATVQCYDEAHKNVFRVMK